jgi:hypothetical protein
MIEGGISIHPIFPVWAILVVGIFLLAFLLSKEINRKIRFRKWRIVAVIILLLSIAGLFLQPALQRGVSSQGVVLLTPNYKKEIADSLRKANDQLTFIRTPDAATYSGATKIEALSVLPELNVRFVLGDGLPCYAIRKGVRFQYFKGEPPTAIIHLVSPPVFKANQVNLLSGLFYAKSNSKIKLISPGGPADSVTYSTSGLHKFTLSFKPQASGLFVYTVDVQDGNEVLSQKLPVEVASNEKLNVLVIQNFPTSEVKYMKNFLIEQGHRLVVRSQLSKNNYRYEYANHDQVRIDRLSPDLLNAFDLLITDNETLESFNNTDKRMLEVAVENGLGVVQLFNSINKKNTNEFLSIPIKDYPKDTVQLHLDNAVYTLSTWPLSINSNNTSILQTKNRVLSGFIDRGAGKIGFQFLQETYRLILQGKQLEYSLIWSPLLERSARFKNQPSKIQLENTFPIYPDEPIALNVIATKADVRLNADGIALPLREDLVTDNYFHGKTWAGKHGWHQFSMEEDLVTKNYYVSDEHEWQSLRRAQQQKANELVSQNYKVGLSSDQSNKEEKSISLLLFFITFLLSAGFLWLVPKL